MSLFRLVLILCSACPHVTSCHEWPRAWLAVNLYAESSAVLAWLLDERVDQ